MNSEFNIIPVETDVLVIGGGLSGCMAAIKAAEEGADVTIAEKANVVRSGQNGSGVDHIWAWIPEVHGKMGWSLEDLVEDHFQGQAYGFMNKEIFYRIAAESYNRVLDLESYGIKFRYDDSPLPGKFRIVPQFHTIASSLNFDGRNIKPILSREVSKRGVRVINRVMMTDLLITDGQVAGALGVGTRTGDIHFFKAKSVILSTGRSMRLTRNVTGTDFNLGRPPGMTGDGKTMAVHAGCRLINMEFFGRRFLNIGPYIQSTGSPRSTTWPAGALVSSDGKTLVRKTWFTNWDKYLGDGAEKIDFTERRNKWLNALKGWPTAMERWKKGEGPFFLDCTGGSEEEIAYVEWSWSHEGKGWLFLRHLEEEGFDLRKDMIEFTLNNAQMTGFASSGVWVDDHLETGISGLYVAGDEIGGFPWFSSQGAAGSGWFAGEMASNHAARQASFLPVDNGKQEALIERCTRIVESRNGAPWKEAERSIQDIMDFYRGDVRTEQTLLRGLERVKDVRNNVFLKAENPHELIRCLEIGSIMDNAEYVLKATLERKETRMHPFQFFRNDYPEQDDENFFAFLGMTRKKGELTFSKISLEKI
ncbi:MAG: FAD-dependent oxidoreductase [Deltaproteobacteria bacterium]|nr:FAD-dependent oxidoreductase [Deltaproteobacteria bacterium]